MRTVMFFVIILVMLVVMPVGSAKNHCTNDINLKA